VKRLLLVPVVALLAGLTACSGSDDISAPAPTVTVTAPAPAAEAPPAPAPEPAGLSAAEEFEVELLVAFVWIGDPTMAEACDWVDTIGAEAYADAFAEYYDPSMTTSQLPYNREGAVQALDTWCSL
jgi:hypothetical protein